MFRTKSLTALASLALGLIVAPLAHAQGSTTPATTTTTESAAPAAKPEAKAPAKSHAMKAPAMAKVDLNTASKEDLMKVPGIGDAIADKIIAGRPFAMKSELLSKGLVNKAQYKKLSAHVIAKKAAEAK